MELLYIINNNLEFLSPYTGGSSYDLFIVPHGVLGPGRALSPLLAIPPPPYLPCFLASLPYPQRPRPGVAPAPLGITGSRTPTGGAEELEGSRFDGAGVWSAGLHHRDRHRPQVSREGPGEGVCPGRSPLEASPGLLRLGGPLCHSSERCCNPQLRSDLPASLPPRLLRRKATGRSCHLRARVRNYAVRTVVRTCTCAALAFSADRDCAEVPKRGKTREGTRAGEACAGTRAEKAPARNSARGPAEFRRARRRRRDPRGPRGATARLARRQAAAEARPRRRGRLGPPDQTRRSQALGRHSPARQARRSRARLGQALPGQGSRASQARPGP